MDRINAMHTYLLYIIFGIAIFVTALLLITIYKFRESKNKTPSKVAHNTFLEIVWTLIPLIIVCAIAIPSIKLIYYMDKTHDAEMTLKVIGHQWYWEYDYPDHKISFDSYMLEGEKLKPEHLRYLDVDKQVVLPVETNVRILATSADVLHSWAVPAFGIKQDTIPGRLRETWVRIKKPGVYYGQCSELCGLNHGFMSIAVKAVPKAEFEAWVRQEGGEIPTPETAEAPATAMTQIIADPHAVPPAPNADLQSTSDTQ
jgi:cytochrome c oxidase, subunit II